MHPILDSQVTTLQIISIVVAFLFISGLGFVFSHRSKELRKNTFHRLALSLGDLISAFLLVLGIPVKLFAEIDWMRSSEVNSEEDTASSSSSSSTETWGSSEAAGVEDDADPPREKTNLEEVTPFTTSSNSNKVQNGSKPTHERSVSFGEIQVREYNRILGDCPYVAVGPPIGIGWDYVQSEAVDVGTYEENRPPKKDILRLVSFDRRRILYEFQVTEKEIKAAINKIKEERKATEIKGGKKQEATKQGKVPRDSLKAVKRRLSGSKQGKAQRDSLKNVKRRLSRSFSKEHS